MMKALLKEKVLHSGLIFTALSLMAGAGNFLFQMIINRQLTASGESGFANTTDTFTGLLGLPMGMASTAIIHHIAHFRGMGDEARLQGLLAGCRSFLLKFTIVACLLGLVLIQPLSHYFNIPRATLTMTALVSLIVGLWSGYAAALANGMGWFKRLALIGIAGVVVKLVFVWTVTRRYPVAEVSVLAVAMGALLNVAVFVWWRDLFKPGERISPWDREFFRYLIVAAAGVGAQWCFTKSDVLAASRNHLTGVSLDAFTGAGKIAGALHLAVAPLLTVLLTARSSERSGRRLGGPLGLLVLYAAGLAVGGLVLFCARDLSVQLLRGGGSPETNVLVGQMLGRLALTMIFVGLIQALGIWAIASNWFKVSLLYGALGVAYWATLVNVGTTPEAMLNVMPVITGLGFVIMFVVWLVTLRRSRAA